ncbi:MAG TPA: hypothetical protein VLJ60_11360, partial [bacterium]|nr:hypothetical protein [bacterium]
MIKKYLFSLFFLTVMIFSGCAKDPGDKKIEDTIAKIKKEMAEKCGDGTVDSWEECDYSGTRSCSEQNDELIGPLRCTSCKIDITGCADKNKCDADICKGNGTCLEEHRHYIYCECFELYAGPTCNRCTDNYHFDLDGKCIENTECTLVGCMENSTCQIIAGQAECICDDPYTGKNCDVCKTYYYMDNGVCRGKLCFNTDIECTQFEKCADDSGKPRCICKGANQNSLDCSECDEGYGWYKNEGCFKEKSVPCATDPQRPENSANLIQYVLIKYSEGTGWSEPGFCEWKCVSGYYPDKNECINIEVFYSSGPDFPFGFDKNGDLIAGDIAGNIYVVSTEISGTIPSGIPITNGRIGTDGNIYFRTSSGYGVINYETGANFYFRKDSIPQNQLTLSKDGTVFFGDTYFSFPDLIPVHPDLENENAVTLTDSYENTITVYKKGYVVYSDNERNTLWFKEYPGYVFSEHPALTYGGFVFIPHFQESSSRVSGLVVNLSNGEFVDVEETSYSYTVTSLKYAPAVSVDSDNRKFVSNRGVMTVYDSDGTELFDTSSLFNERWSVENLPPVITTQKIVYFANDFQILAFREIDQKTWSYNLPSYSFPRTLLHNNETLYVFTSKGELFVLKAPGTIGGEWPHMYHDSALSGMTGYLPQFQKPSSSILISPADDSSFSTGSVTFSWNNDPENAGTEHALLIRDSTGYDKVHAGLQTDRSTASV